ncbi:unnamed protein product [Symbiodinium natans]|uniref:Uncharacterized protein n=1 Tax=Symbiodinium natans TaxID=878477 RepID=A0A812UST0_9DINO|nr:unnamed protein product [Symbiodinium natans]CAE7580359.1 unnamed protein product [Symbiodinium natans]
MSETRGERGLNALLTHLTGVPNADERRGLTTAARRSSSAVLWCARCLQAAKFTALAARSAPGQHITAILRAKQSALVAECVLIDSKTPRRCSITGKRLADPASQVEEGRAVEGLQRELPSDKLVRTLFGRAN